MDALLVAAVFFLGAFTESLTGFGVALVAMALLPGMIGMQLATPLVALAALSIEIVLLIYYRSALNVKAVWPLVLASIFGIPLGINALRQVNENLVMFTLGVLLTGYALYALSNLRLPELKHPAWAYTTGFLAGLLGGAYNTSGPPVIVYGNCRRWPPAEFKGNLQGFFIVNSSLVVLGHAWSGNLTSQVWSYYLWALPAIALGIFLGLRLDRRVDPTLFRKIVLWLLVLMGARLAVMAWMNF